MDVQPLAQPQDGGVYAKQLEAAAERNLKHFQRYYSAARDGYEGVIQAVPSSCCIMAFTVTLPGSLTIVMLLVTERSFGCAPKSIVS